VRLRVYAWINSTTLKLSKFKTLGGKLLGEWRKLVKGFKRRSGMDLDSPTLMIHPLELEEEGESEGWRRYILVWRMENLA